MHRYTIPVFVGATVSPRARDRTSRELFEDPAEVFAPGGSVCGGLQIIIQKSHSIISTAVLCEPHLPTS